jgi:DnaJ-class molecular chaperone
MNYTDINSRSGKGSRLEHNVSTKRYREGWDKIFGKKRSKPISAPKPEETAKCPECDGYGELPQGTFAVPCRVCGGTGRLAYEN